MVAAPPGARHHRVPHMFYNFLHIYIYIYIFSPIRPVHRSPVAGLELPRTLNFGRKPAKNRETLKNIYVSYKF
jgi:hypothetical protein